MKWISACISFWLFQTACYAQYEFIAPMNASMYHDVSRNIILRPGAILDLSSVKKNIFHVTGIKSGIHDFKLITCNDRKTIILQPLAPFDYDEKVVVNINGALHDANGNSIPAYSFYFLTQQKFTPEQEAGLKEAQRLTQDLPEEESQTSTDTLDVQNPLYTILVNKDAAPGQIFFSTFSGLSLNKPKHLWIIDNNGDSVFSQKTPYRTYDFKINHIGYPTVFDTRLQAFDVLDSNFVRMAHFHCQNRYFTDDHEFQIFPDHRLFIIGDQYGILSVQPNDSTPPHNAFVVENVIQELDGDSNVVFEWRSIDHMSVNEASHENLFAGFIDPVHMNAIELDADGNILVSCRKLDQIDKIDVKTGNFIWRLGGLKDEFTFTNDPAEFNYQHDIRRLPNGDITLFDNGPYHVPSQAFAKEYKLDEVNKTATLVWSYAHPYVNGNPVASTAEGNVQRLPNGNTLINWGWIPYNSGFPNVTEVDANGNITWEMQCDPANWNVIYRAYKFDWNPCARPSAKKMKATLINDSSALFSWNQSSSAIKYFLQYRKEGSGFWNSMSLPASQFSITANHLSPNSHYEWRTQTWCDSTGINHSGFTNKLSFNTGEARNSADNNYFSLYPNPAKNEIVVSWKPSSQLNSSIIEIEDQLGNIMNQLHSAMDDHSAMISVSNLKDGVYFIKLINGESVFTQPFVKMH